MNVAAAVAMLLAVALLLVVALIVAISMPDGREPARALERYAANLPAIVTASGSPSRPSALLRAEWSRGAWKFKRR
jgi:hypothetical protein